MPRKKTRYTSAKIFKLYEGWKSYMEESWDRGEQNIDFIERSNQQFNYNGSSDREQLIFNLSKNALRIAQARGKDIDLSLTLKNPSCSEDNKDKKISSKIVHRIMLNHKNSRAFGYALDKVYAFGQAVLHIKPVRENEQTLNECLEIENIRDVTQTFFDYKCQSLFKHDGNFCGRIFLMDRKHLEEIYPNFEFSKIGDDCKVADFWYKSFKKEQFVKLNNGVWKRKDLVDPVRDMVDLSEKEIDGWVTKINYVRVAQGVQKFLENKKNLPFEFLPMCIDPGGFLQDGKYSNPLGYDFRGTQLALNYVGSACIDIAKRATADKWLFGPQHVESDVARNSAININATEGGMIFDDDIAGIRREVGQQIPPSLVALFETLKKTLNELTGSYFDQGSADLKAVSGIALDKMYDRADLKQNNEIEAHLQCVNVVGQIMKSMIPYYYRQNRIIDTCTIDGKEEVIEINKPVTMPNGAVVLDNNIKEICKRYNFQIDASPSDSMQKKNTQTLMNLLYQYAPEAKPLTMDLYAESMDIPISDELAKRISVNIPEELVQYGKGIITYQQYQQISSKKQQKQMQMQQQMMMNSPEAKYKNAQASSAISKAQTDSFEAQTARIKELNTALTDHEKNEIESEKIAFNNENEKGYLDLEYDKALISQLEKGIKKE
jgi:hypothetical protein